MDINQHIANTIDIKIQQSNFIRPQKTNYETETGPSVTNLDLK